MVEITLIKIQLWILFEISHKLQDKQNSELLKTNLPRRLRTVSPLNWTKRRGRLECWKIRGLKLARGLKSGHELVKLWRAAMYNFANLRLSKRKIFRLQNFKPKAGAIQQGFCFYHLLETRKSDPTMTLSLSFQK